MGPLSLPSTSTTLPLLSTFRGSGLPPWRIAPLAHFPDSLLALLEGHSDDPGLLALPVDLGRSRCQRKKKGRPERPNLRISYIIQGAQPTSLPLFSPFRLRTLAVRILATASA